MWSVYQGNDSLLILDILFPHHGVGLASACLAISKDADIVSLESVQQHFLSDVFVHSHLRGIIDVLGLWTEINNQPLPKLSHKPVKGCMIWSTDNANRVSLRWGRLYNICTVGAQKDLPRCGTSRSNQSWSSCCLWPAWGWWWLKDRTRNTGQREGERRPRETVSELSCHVVLIELRKGLRRLPVYQQNLSVQEGKTSGLISNFKVTHYESNFKRKKKKKKEKPCQNISSKGTSSSVFLWRCDTHYTPLTKKKKDSFCCSFLPTSKSTLWPDGGATLKDRVATFKVRFSGHFRTAQAQLVRLSSSFNGCPIS